MPDMAEIEFADGKFVVDDVYVPAIMEATAGHPKNFTQKAAMGSIGRWLERNVIREATGRLLRDHFRSWGS